MSIAMNEVEEKQIDSQVEQMLDWANANEAEAEQLAMDSARLMACTSERIDSLANQGFFKRCWRRFTGEAESMERANANDLIQIQKIALRYINMLNEHDILLAHSMLSLKNNLLSLAIKEEETRNLITRLAENTLNRFSALEKRVDQLEVSTNLQGWLLGLEEREYNEKYKCENLRLFRIINDFYSIKNDNWNYSDLMFMRKAIRIVGLNPKLNISLAQYISNLIKEIDQDENLYHLYSDIISEFKPSVLSNYSKFAIENISSPVFVSIHGINRLYSDRRSVVDILIDEMNITKIDALIKLLHRDIESLNVDLSYQFPLAETAIEILGCTRLIEKIYYNSNSNNKVDDNDVLNYEKKSENSPDNSKKKESIFGNVFSRVRDQAGKICRIPFNIIGKRI